MRDPHASNPVLMPLARHGLADGDTAGLGNLVARGGLARNDLESPDRTGVLCINVDVEQGLFQLAFVDIGNWKAVPIHGNRNLALGAVDDDLSPIVTWKGPNTRPRRFGGDRAQAQ